jgi:hypothetical protein
MKLDTRSNAADVKWETHSCVFGFSLMGIWSKVSTGTDINALDVNTVEQGGFVAVADDHGYLSIYNYPW